MVNKKFKLYSLGCKISQYDAAHLGELLKSAGLCPVVEGADIAVISTCSVTKSAVMKNKWAVNKARRENPNALVILCGCWPRVYQDEASRSGADLVWAEKDLVPLVQKICTTLPSKNAVVVNKTADRSRYFLKIQDGCEQFCAYCIIPYARGKLSSRPLAAVLAEAQAAARSGFREIVISGVHLGLYGINNADKKAEEKDVDLIRLLKELVLIDEIKKIRLSSLEIREADEKLLELMTKEKKLCRHLHLPLQSGCDRTLRAMRRPYDTAFFRERVALFRRAFPEIAISTDVIVGFPGESAADFEATKKFLEELAFSRLHVFSFSQRPGTPACELSPKVPAEEIKKRSSVLRQLDLLLREKYSSRFSGSILEAVVEARRGDLIKVKTEYYFDVWTEEKNIIFPAGISKDASIGEVVGLRLD